MEIDNKSVVNEEEVYDDLGSETVSNISYGELVSVGSSKINSVPFFKPEWQTFPEFQCWLRPIPEDKTRAWCRACEKVFKADLKSLRVHGVGKSHARLLQFKFPNEIPISTPSVAYNVITDRKGTYGIGIISKPDVNVPVTGNTLYVNPTNPNTNVLTSDPKRDKDDSVVVSMPNFGQEKHARSADTTNSFQQMPVSDNGKPNMRRNARQHLQETEVRSGLPNNNERKTVVSNASDKIQEIEHVSAEDLIEMEDVEDIYELELPNDKVKKIKKAPHMKVNSNSKIKVNRKSRKTSRLVPPGVPVCIYSKPTVSKSAPYWEGRACVEGRISKLASTDYKEKYLVLFFYQHDFSDTSPSEISSLSEHITDFRDHNADVVACSVDSCLAHQAWCRVGPENNGVLSCKIALLSDRNHKISKKFGCYISSKGYCSSSTYIIDPKNIIRHIGINDTSLPRNVNEILRLVKAFKYADDNQASIPMNWRPGQPSLSLS